MHAQLSAHLLRQNGLVLRRQALAAGVLPTEIDRLVRSGAWVVVRRGVYTTGEGWARLDDHRGKPLLRAWAASLAMRMPHVLSHESAALAHGLPILRTRPPLVHITRFGVTGCRTKHGVCHHLAPFEPHQIDEVAGIATFDRARTAVDIARNHGQDGLRFGLVACDSALRAGVSRAELWRSVEPMANWPNVTIAREAIRLADPGSESVGESLSRLLVVGLLLGEVETQFGLARDDRAAFADVRVGRHLIEFDGRAKYQRDGLADRPVEEVVWEEKRRQDWLCGFKLGMSRLVWADVMPSAWARTQAWLAADIRDTHARFGTSIGDLAPYVVRRRRRSA